MKLQGIPYFPYPSANDDKLRFLEAKFRLKGTAIYLKLLQKIYSQNGYYYAISDKTISLLKMECNLSATDCIISEIIDFCLQEEIWSKEMYDKHSILTSEEIQKEYLNAVRKRKNIQLNKDYLLGFALQFYKSAEETQKTAEETQKTAEELNKEKKTKQNKIKIKLNENKINPNKKSDDLAGASLSDNKIEKFKIAFPHKLIDTDTIAESVDMDKLIQAINNSPFLRGANNFTLKVCCKYYDAILAGKYAQAQNVMLSTNKQHQYPAEKLESLYTNIDNIDV